MVVLIHKGLNRMEITCQSLSVSLSKWYESNYYTLVVFVEEILLHLDKAVYLAVTF